MPNGHFVSLSASFRSFLLTFTVHGVSNKHCLFKIGTFFIALQSELQLLQSIIPEKYQRSVYDNIVQPGLESVVNEGEVSHGKEMQLYCIYLREMATSLSYLYFISFPDNEL